MPRSETSVRANAREGDIGVLSISFPPVAANFLTTFCYEWCDILEHDAAVQVS
jgi:hypothetical protein